MLLPVWLSVDASGRQQVMASPWALAIWETLMGFLTPGFDLAQTRLSWEFGGMNPPVDGRYLSPSVVCYSVFQINKSSKQINKNGQEVPQSWFTNSRPLFQNLTHRSVRRQPLGSQVRRGASAQCPCKAYCAGILSLRKIRLD